MRTTPWAIAITILALSFGAVFSGCDLTPGICKDSHEMRETINMIRGHLVKDIDLPGTWGMGCTDILDAFKKKFSGYKATIRTTADFHLKKAINKCVGDNVEEEVKDGVDARGITKYKKVKRWDPCATETLDHYEYIQPGFDDAQKLIKTLGTLETDITQLCSEFIVKSTDPSYIPRTQALIKLIDEKIIGVGIAMYVQAGCPNNKAFALFKRNDGPADSAVEEAIATKTTDGPTPPKALVLPGDKNENSAGKKIAL